MKSPGIDIDLTDDDDTVLYIKRAKLKLQTHYCVTKGVKNSDVLKVVNKITSQSATCYHKIPLLTIYIHETPLHTRNQYTEIRNKY